MNQIETLRREHTCPDCSGSFMPVSHRLAGEAGRGVSAAAGWHYPVSPPPLSPWRTLRRLIYERAA